MAHNEKMLEERQAKWGDNLRIIGVSFDKDKDKLKNSLNSKGYTKVEQFWKNTSDIFE